MNYAQDSYLERTSRPIYAVLFLLPFILFYEYGTLRIIRVVAFVWLQNFLESVGFGGKFAMAAPPIAVIAILLAFQITSRKQWSFWLYDYGLMVIECVLLAIPLIVLTLFLSTIGSRYIHKQADKPDTSAAQQVWTLPSCSSVNSNHDMNSTGSIQNNCGREHPLMANIVTGIGAGIYEELVFRLILICILMVIFQDIFKMTHINAVVLSVLISAALFSAHHHVDFFSGKLNEVDPFDVTEFAFRTIAGIYFAILYAVRGFGITAGTHAFYNIIAELISAGFFHR